MKILVYTSIYSTEYEKYYLSLFYIFNQNIKLLSVLTDREFKKLIEIYFMILDYLNTKTNFMNMDVIVIMFFCGCCLYSITTLTGYSSWIKKNQYVSSDNDMKKITFLLLNIFIKIVDIL